jgi:hypothetical protein
MEATFNTDDRLYFSEDAGATWNPVAEDKVEEVRQRLQTGLIDVVNIDEPGDEDEDLEMETYEDDEEFDEEEDWEDEDDDDDDDWDFPDDEDWDDWDDED